MATNGVGPWWFPKFIRDWLTEKSSEFFSEASWSKHDEGYSARFPKRFICDIKFYRAMLTDASKLSPNRQLRAFRLARFFYITLRLFGWISWHWPDWLARPK